MLDTVREHVLRLEDQQQGLNAKLLKMTTSLEASREQHRVRAVAAAVAAVVAADMWDRFVRRALIPISKHPVFFPT